MILHLLFRLYLLKLRKRQINNNQNKRETKSFLFYYFEEDIEVLQCFLVDLRIYTTL